MTYEDYLSHHGVLGMKWGVRRYQNKDGSLTAAGIRRRKKLIQDANKADDLYELSRRHKESALYYSTFKSKQEAKDYMKASKRALKTADKLRKKTQKGADFLESIGIQVGIIFDEIGDGTYSKRDWRKSLPKEQSSDFHMTEEEKEKNRRATEKWDNMSAEETLAKYDALIATLPKEFLEERGWTT